MIIMTEQLAMKIIELKSNAEKQINDIIEQLEKDTGLDVWRIAAPNETSEHKVWIMFERI